MNVTKEPKLYKVSYTGTWYSGLIDGIQVGEIKITRSNPLSLELFRAPYFNQKMPSVYVANLEVAENYRKKGIGSKLLRFAEGLAFEDGLAYSRLNAYPEPELTAFYTKNGYKLLGRFPYRNGHVNFFQKRLTSTNQQDLRYDGLCIMIRG